jgi:hypothetical protein
MSEDLPAPLVPAEVDLRGLPFMPLDTVRLLDSDFFALATGDEFKAAIALWAKAWQQVPAGSLPDDDRILAHLSGAGPKWRKVKGMALRGFLKCSDGRLYHPVIAEKTVEAWQQRVAYETRKAEFSACQSARARKRWQSHGNASAGAERMPDDAGGIDPASPPVMPMKGKGKGKEKESPPLAPSEGADRTARGTRISEDWEPTDADRDFARKLGLDPDRVRAEFVDYWRAVAGRAGLKLDWSATFRNRCRQIADRAPLQRGRANGAGAGGPAAPDYTAPIPQHRTPKSPPPTG